MSKTPIHLSRNKGDMTPQERLSTHIMLSQMNDQELVDAGIHKPDHYFTPIITYPAMSNAGCNSRRPYTSRYTAAAAHRCLYSRSPILHHPLSIWSLGHRHPPRRVTRYLKCLDLEFERHNNATASVESSTLHRFLSVRYPHALLQNT